MDRISAEGKDKETSRKNENRNKGFFFNPGAFSNFTCGCREKKCTEHETSPFFSWMNPMLNTACMLPQPWPGNPFLENIMDFQKQMMDSFSKMFSMENQEGLPFPFGFGNGTDAGQYFSHLAQLHPFAWMMGIRQDTSSENQAD